VLSRYTFLALLEALCYNLRWRKKRNLKVTTERLENCQVALTIEIEKERVEKALRDAAKRISQKTNIPGFRRGKAPYSVVLQRFGKEALYREALDELGKAAYKEALEETGIEPFAPAKLDEINFEPMVLRMTVPLPPIVELGDYKEIRLTKEKAEVTEEEIASALSLVQEENATWEPVERPARLGDLVIMDVRGKVGERTVIEEEEREFILNPDFPYPLPGFDEKVVGMKAEERREFTLTYPDASSPVREAHFEVYLHLVKEKVLPPIDDDLAKTVGDYETLEELKEDLRRRLEARADAEAEIRFADRVIDAVIERSRVEFPPVMVEREIDSILAEQERRLRGRGMSLDNYLNSIEKDVEDYRAEIRSIAEERLKRSLVLREVAKLEGIEVTSEEVEREIERLSKPFGEKAEAMRKRLSSPEGVRSIKFDLLTSKALQILVTIAKGEMQK
jgi:trigger factor